MRLQLDLFSYRHLLKTKNELQKPWIFDPVRNKYLVLQPEELVRQLFVQYLLNEKKVPKVKIGIEKQFLLNGLKKRTDIVVYDQKLSPFLLVECKSPDINLQQAVFDQASRYNLQLKAPYLVVTNGYESFCFSIDFEIENYTFLPEIPDII